MPFPQTFVSRTALFREGATRGGGGQGFPGCKLAPMVGTEQPSTPFYQLWSWAGPLPPFQPRF